MKKNRATFSTKLGVLAATVGSSVGLGNIWKFPYETGINGGAAFLIVYLVCILLLGIPVIMAEFIIGRHAKANVVESFKILSPKTNWYFIGVMGVLAAVIILGFYFVIAGWSIDYLYQSLSGGLAGMNAEQIRNEFTSFSSHPFRPLIWVFLFILLNYFVVSKGLRNGIEKISNILMPLLFLILLIFCVRNIFLPGFSEGMEFLFKPDFSKITATAVLSAMGHAFFSLSLGMGCLITYSSYFNKDTHLARTATQVAFLDTLVAILAAIVIFPAVFSFGVSPTQGPELIFVTLPNVFNLMPGGFFWGVLFFLLVTIAALTSTISLCEVATAYLNEHFHLSRRRATISILCFCAFLSVFSSLSFGPLKDATIAGFTFFELAEKTASNILLPLGGMFISLYVGWVLPRKIVLSELTNSGKLKLPFFSFFLFLLRFVAPAIIAIVFFSNLGLLPVN